MSNPMSRFFRYVLASGMSFARFIWHALALALPKPSATTPRRNLSHWFSMW